LLGYALIGLVVCAVQFALGEVSALFPVTGSFVRHAELLVDPALGFAVGWNVVYGNFLSVPSEISAAVVLIQYWTDKYAALWITLFILVTFGVGIVFVGIYGEVEFFFAMLKILLVVGVVIMGLVIDLGGVPSQPRIGFQYWNNPGPFVEYIASGSWGNFLGFWAVMNNAVYSFAGVESVSVAAAETQNPRQNIPKACKRVFARVALFYILAVLIVGMLVPSDDPALDDTSGTAAQSPFVIAATRAGISAIPSLVNAVVLTSAFSASNQALLAGTRILYGLALKDQAPKVFLRTTKYGIPYVCVAVQTAVASLAFMSLSNGALTVFYWFLDLTAAGVLVSWGVIALNHIRLHRALAHQGISREELPWHHWWTRKSNLAPSEEDLLIYPKNAAYTSWFALISCILFLLTGGFTVFAQGYWDTATFISSYL
jgi:yeast amino acid transporter